MKIAILNGNPSDKGAFERYLNELERGLIERKHSVANLRLREMNVHDCLGCFTCWLKTPGRCAQRDDGQKVCRSYIDADLAIFASPLIMGHSSALLKRSHDRLFALIHPYFMQVGGEMHHRPRYRHYPRLAVLLEKGGDADDEDVAIVKEMYRRDAINLNTSLAGPWLSNRPVREIIHALDRL